MKYKYRSILICLLLLVSVSNGKIHARSPEENKTNIVTQKVNPTSGKESRDRIDVAPMFKSAIQLLNKRSNQIESEMVLTGDTPGVRFISNVKIKTITEFPNKLNSEITFFNPNGLTGKKYQVISDGERVWIYDFSTNYYSVDSYQDFLDSSDTFFIGMLSYLYLSLHEDTDNNYAKLSNNLPEPEMINFLDSALDLNYDNLSVREKKAGNSTYKIYKIDDPKQDYIVDLFIDVSTNEVEIVSLSGEESGLDIVMKENIIIQTTPQSQQEFQFIPPKGSERVGTTLEIEPF